jgi:predicted AlkP superfamily phosphohydrolase/phosphomutase
MWLRRVLIKPLAVMLRAHARRRDLPVARDSETDDERRAQAFFMSPNNFVVGGVRINLSGRENEGIVEPGQELGELYRRLESDLLALVNVEAATSVIDRVERSDAHYEREPLDALPDLFLEWNHDHPIETVWSPRLGIIHGPYTHWRTGDHQPGGLLLARRPGAAPEEQGSPLEINRLAALIAEELDVELSDADRAPEAGLGATR